MLGRKKYTFAEAFKPYNTPDIGDGLPGAQPAPLESQYKPGFWQGGDKFGGRDAIAAILASIGDALMRQSGGQGGAVGNLAGGRLSARDMAMKQAQKQAEIEATRQRYQAAGIDPAKADLAAHGDDSGWLPKPETPHYFEDNAGNQWRTGPNGPERVFTDRVPKMYIQGDQAVQIDNPYLDQPPPQAPVGRLTPLGGAQPPASPPFPPVGVPRRRRY